jgi:uncharacterized UPF0160 family protein
MSTYIGTSAESVYAAVQNRYFYGLRRTDNGELFLGKVDQLKAADTLTINKPGEPTENFPNFQEGQDFYEGRNVFHDLVYENLNYEQFRWDDRNVLYYINDEGELVLRVNQNHTYTDGDSSNGL